MIKFKMFSWPGETEKVSISEPAPTAEPEVACAPSNGVHVLIVDDDSIFLKATSMKLQSAGFEVSTAAESSEALAIVAERPVDVVLMDINFPPDVSNGGMGSWDGFQIMYWMRGLPQVCKARFIVVSQSDSAEFRKRSQSMGAKAFFQKPLNHEALFALLNAEN